MFSFDIEILKKLIPGIDSFLAIGIDSFSKEILLRKGLLRLFGRAKAKF